MINDLSRRCFLKSAAAGALCSSSLLAMLQQGDAASGGSGPLVPISKVRVGRLFVGRTHPGWPSSTVDLEADAKAFEKALAKISPQLRDYEFVDVGIVSDDRQMSAAMEKFKDVEGVLVIHLTMGITGHLQKLFQLNVPIVLFSLPYTGHEWHTIASWQQQGKPIEVYPTSRCEDVIAALRPMRAIHRVKEARILHISTAVADVNYCAATRKKFGTEIISLKFEDLKAAYEAADRSEAMADARRWIKEASKIVEPTRQEIIDSSVMYIAMRNLLAEHKAVAVTMNCLGMGLMDRGMAYPCLGFVRLNNMGLGGVCEADLKSTMTHVIFSSLVGVPGFVTDPVFDLSTGTIIHAHCVAATQMEGPDQRQSKYHIRSHLEDGRGVSLMVKMPTARKLCMARLIGQDIMLFSTGDAVDSPFVERGCRTKVTMKVENIEKFLDNWSCGLHRVVFYGDHTRDIKSYCRFANIRLVQEGVDDLKSIEGLEWRPQVHA